MQNKQETIDRTVGYAKKMLQGESSGHDWWHVYRVWKNAIQIGRPERADMFVVELAALLHDIADWKFFDGDETVGPSVARRWLESIEVEEDIIAHVCDIIKNISFKGANTKSEMATIEGKVVQDADRLDAIGAIGIARVFAFGGHTNREIYDPEVKPQIHETSEQYKNNKSPSINHFYEKLLLLKDRMNTQNGKMIASQRHQYMQNYLDKFFKEWEGEDFSTAPLQTSEAWLSESK